MPIVAATVGSSRVATAAVPNLDRASRARIRQATASTTMSCHRWTSTGTTSPCEPPVRPPRFTTTTRVTRMSATVASASR